MKTIWNKETGEPMGVESVDAREMLRNSPDLYTSEDPKPKDPKDPDGDGKEGAPQHVADVENEFRREPVGDDAPGPEREGVIIRNPVTDKPRMVDPATKATVVEEEGDLDAMTVPELKDYAVAHNVDLGDATLKADILKKIKKSQKAAAQ